MYLPGSSSRGSSGLPDPPEINFSKVVVGGDIGGLVFAVGCVVAVLGGFPVFIPVFVASLVLGVLLAIGLIGWRRTHAPRATSLRVAAVALLMLGLSADPAPAQQKTPDTPGAPARNATTARNTAAARDATATIHRPRHALSYTSGPNCTASTSRSASTRDTLRHAVARVTTQRLEEDPATSTASAPSPGAYR